MRRLMIAATLLLATANVSVWAQAQSANDPHHPAQTAGPASAQSMPPAAITATNCGGNAGATTAEGQNSNCPMGTDNMKSGEGTISTQQMMHDMMHGRPQSVAKQHDHGHNNMKCCEMSKADKPR